MNQRPNLVIIVLSLLLTISIVSNITFYWFTARQPVTAATTPTTAQSMVSKQIETNRFQAVFLTNGQLYFGKLSLVDSSNYKLSDVYYLTASDSSTLKKLGAELHRPEDAMIIPTTQVLFFENLQSAAQFNGQLQ